MFPLIACFLLFFSYVFFLFITLYYVYDLIIIIIEGQITAVLGWMNAILLLNGLFVCQHFSMSNDMSSLRPSVVLVCICRC